MNVEELMTELKWADDDLEVFVYSCPQCHDFRNIKEVRETAEKVVINICTCSD